MTVADIDNLETLGVAVNIVNDLKNNNACGSTGEKNCLAAFNAQKASSTCTLENGSNATAAQMQAYISCVMIEHHTTIANAVSVPSTSSTSGNSCTVAVTGPVPSTCAHPQWTCTIEGEPTPTGWQVTQSAGLSYASIDLTTSNGAPVTGSYTVRASLGIYTPAYSKAYTYNNVNIPTSWALQQTHYPNIQVEKSMPGFGTTVLIEAKFWQLRMKSKLIRVGVHYQLDSI